MTAAALSLFPARTPFAQYFALSMMHSLKPTYFPCHPTVPSTIAASPATADTRSPSSTARISLSLSTRIFSVGQRGMPVCCPANCPRHRLPRYLRTLPIAQMTRECSWQPELRNNCVHIDLYLSSFATCFPMITKPSIVQLDLDDVNDDTLAINFVVCKPLDYHHLLALQPDNGNELVFVDI